MAVSSSTPAMNAPKAKQAADLPKAPVGQDTAANALPQKAVKQAKGAESANIQQNPQFVAGQNIEKTKQQNLESADNIDEPEEEHVEGDKEEVASSPFMQARGASRKLDDMLGGLNTNVGAGGGDADASPGGGLEIAANKIETPGMLEETEEGKFPLADKLGVKILATDDSDKVVAARLAAQDYKENVEKLLKKYTSVDDKVENWRPDKGLVDRVIADTREQLDAAKSLIYAMRNGRGSPSGHGMSA
jgi:hypothetical protein